MNEIKDPVITKPEGEDEGSETESNDADADDEDWDEVWLPDWGEDDDWSNDFEYNEERIGHLRF